MEQIQKEKEEKVDAQKSTEKKMKFYMVLSFVFGLSLSFVIANLIVGCDDRAEVNNTVRYTNVGRAINDVMQEKETVAGMKVDRVVKQGLDSIGIFEKDEKRGFYNQNTDKVLVDAVYTHVWFFSEGLAAVEKDGKIGFVNMKGKLVIPHKFMLRTNDHPDIAFSNGMCVIANGNGQLGVIDRKGEWIVKPVYEEVKLTDSGIIASTSNSKSLLNNKGEVLQKDLVVKVNR